MPLTLESDDNQLVKWWIDASFAVHPDMKSHTGGLMSLRKGVFMAHPHATRQNLVTKSSTEAEFVGVSDVLPQVVYGQGISSSHRGTKFTTRKYTRTIKVQYFFKKIAEDQVAKVHGISTSVTDRNAGKEMSVQYCSTEDVASDFFKKPLQGYFFASSTV
jgi:hypothetical protein